jgi:hypothetical protein
MADTRVINTGDSVSSHTQPGIHLNIFFQNVTSVRTKHFEIYINVSPIDYNILCLTETWLNYLFYDHNLFPGNFNVFRSDRVYTNKARYLFPHLTKFAPANAGTNMYELKFPFWTVQICSLLTIAFPVYQT